MSATLTTATNMWIKNYGLQMFVTRFEKIELTVDQVVCIDDVDEFELNKVVGFKNMGNTCFMNGTIQCLIHTQHTNYFGFNYIHALLMICILARNYARLIYDVIMSRDKPGKGKVVLPYLLHSEFTGALSQFSDDKQHDAQEFMTIFLDGLREYLNLIWNDIYLGKCNSICSDLLSGLIKSTVICPECNENSITFNPFMNLALPLKTKKNNKNNKNINDSNDRKVDINLCDEPEFRKETQFTFIYISNDEKEAPKKYSIDVSKDIIEHNCWTKFFATIYEYCTYKIERKAKDNWKEKAISLRQYRRNIYSKMNEKERYSSIFYPEYDVNKESINEEQFKDYYINKGEFDFDKDLNAMDLNYYYIGQLINFNDNDSSLSKDLVEDDELGSTNEPKIKEYQNDTTREIYVRKLPFEMLVNTEQNKYTNITNICQQIDTFKPIELIKNTINTLYGYLPKAFYNNSNNKVYNNNTNDNKRKRKYKYIHIDNNVDSNNIICPVNMKRGINKNISVNDLPTTTNIEECFEMFVKQEILNNANKRICKKCKIHRQTANKLHLMWLSVIIEAESTLDIFYKNTQNHNNSNNNNSNAADFIYDLFGTINHAGSSNHGYYYHDILLNDDEWYQINDSKVSQTSEDDILRTNASILFYFLFDLLNFFYFNTNFVLFV